MNQVGLKKKISTKTYHQTSLFLIISLLGINYLLYAFFEIEILKVPIRLCVMFIMLVVYFYREKLGYHNIIIVSMAVYLILIQGTLTINIAFLLVAGMCLSQINEEIIYKYMNIINMVVLIIVVFSLLTGFEVSERIVTDGRTREDFGFDNVNSAGLLIYSIVSVFVLSSKKIKTYHAILAIALVVFVYMRTNSRTSFYGTVALLVLQPIFSVIPYYIKKIFLPIACFLMFISPLFWLTPGMQTHEMNLKYSFRPWLFKVYFESISRRIFLFGGNTAQDVDNFYLVFLGNAGIILYVGLLFMLIMNIIKLSKNNDNKRLAFIFSSLIIAITETSLIRPEIMSMLAFWVMLFRCFQDIKPQKRPEVGQCKYVKRKT